MVSLQHVIAPCLPFILARSLHGQAVDRASPADAYLTLVDQARSNPGKP
jgi:hypothetical protein